MAGAPSTPLPEGRARARDGAAPVTGAQRSIRGPRHGAHGPQERCSGSDCQTWSRKHRLWGQRLPSPATGMRNQCPSWFIYKDSPGSRIVAERGLPTLLMTTGPSPTPTSSSGLGQRPGGPAAASVFLEPHPSREAWQRKPSVSGRGGGGDNRGFQEGAKPGARGH